MESVLRPLTDRLPPEGKEDPQVDEDSILMDKKYDKEKTLKKLLKVLEEEEEMKCCEKRFTLKEIISYCEYSNIEGRKNYKKALMEKNLNSTNELYNMKKMSKSVKLISKRKFVIPLPKPTSISQQHLNCLNAELDHNLLLEVKQYQKLENVMIKDENLQRYNEEKINKVFQCRLHHASAESRNCWILLSPSAIYIVLNLTEKPYMKYDYSNINLVLHDSSHHWFAIAGKEPRQDELQFVRINVGDSCTTKSLLGCIELYARQHLREKSRLLSRSTSLGKFNRKRSLRQMTNKAWAANLPTFCSSLSEVMIIEEWLLSLVRIKKDETVQKYWLIFWQNGSSEADENNSFSSIEGHFMTRKNSFLSLWKPAYFLLKDGYLYEFSDASDQLPSHTLDMKTCCGCMRQPKSSRPHTILILQKKGPPILMAAPDDHTADQWLEALSFAMCKKSFNKQLHAKEPKIVSCQLLLTQSRLLLIQHNFDCILEHAAITSIKSNVDKGNLRLQELSQSNGIPLDIRTAAVAESSNTLDKSPLHQIYAMQKPPSEIQEPTDKHMKSTTCDKQVTASLRSKTISDDCLATPTHVWPASHSNGDLMLECRQQSRVLSSGNLDHISLICLIGESQTSCLIEFECSEVIEMVGDWIIHFRTNEELTHFLDSVKEYDVQIEHASNIACGKRQNYFQKCSEMGRLAWTCS